MFNKIIRGSCLSAALWAACVAPALAAADDTRSMEELRDTVINLLDALVQKGVITKEQAQAMVANAQAKAAAAAEANAKAHAAQEEADKGAVRVPYVPQIVKDEISKEVAEQVKPQVVQSVEEDAHAQRWGIPGALPDWLSRVRLLGDVRVRYQNDRFPSGDVADYYYDFNSINAAGGIAKAGLNEFLNTTETQNRMRVRARLGAEAQLGDFDVGVRVATGNIQDPSSESQTLGNYGGRYTVGFDEFFIRWAKKTEEGLEWVSTTGGRFANPFFAPTEMVWARDFTFEGLTSTLRWGFGDGDDGNDQSQVFMTIGAYPLAVVPLSTQNNKYLVAGQLGTVLRWGDSDQSLRIAAAYYDFLHVEGIQNPPDLTFYNFSAPAFIRYGNTVFQISNSTTDSTINLFGLASRFRLADVALRYDLPIGRYTFGVAAEGVRNIGYNQREILARTGATIPKEINGEVGELSFGYPTVTEAEHWRAAVYYRYVQADAVIDAFTDADFHGGGTNARGWVASMSLGVAPSTWLQFRYYSSDVINGPQFSLDTIQLDLNAQF